MARQVKHLTRPLLSNVFFRSVSKVSAGGVKISVQAVSSSSFFSIFLFALLMGVAAQASEIIVDANNPHIELNRLLEYYEDVTGKLTINDIASESFGHKFRSSISGDVNFGLTKSVYWVRLQLQQKTASPDHWVLEIPYTHMRYVELYEPMVSDPGLIQYQVQHAGFSVPFENRYLKYRQSAFKVSLGSGAAKTIYLRFQTNGPMWFAMTLWQPHVFGESKVTESYILGIYFGLMFATLFYNAFLFCTLRDIVYLYYILYVSAMAVLFLSINGFGFQYLWPNHPKFAYLNPSLWTGYAAFFLSLFTRSFLGTKASMPRADKLIRFLVWYWGITALPLFLIQFYLGTAFFAYQPTGFLTVVCFLVVGFVALRRGLKPARFYVLSFSAVFVGILAYILRNAGWLPANFITSYSFIAGSALEVVLLSTALADRINNLKREKEIAQRDVVNNKEYAVQALQESNLALQQEIERRRQIELSLFESREKYRVLFETLPVGVMVTDCRGKIIETNHATIGGVEFNRNYFGDVKNTLQFITPSGVPLRKRDRPAFRSLKGGHVIENVEVGVVQAGVEGQPGPMRWLSVTAAPMSAVGYGAIVIYVDITERMNLDLQRRQQQVELARASRFNTMGEMAATLAHEINQPLGAALNYLHGITQRLESDYVDLMDISDGAHQSIKQIERAGSVIRHIYNFTRHHAPQVQTVDLNALIRNIITFAEVDFRRFQTQLQIKLEKSLLPVEVDEIEIGQVILNLIKNGIDAMRDLSPKERVLTIETQVEFEQVKVMVHDRGPGIAADAREKIFDAFFTTKSDGLGLGLAVSRTIVHSHGGKIWVGADRDEGGGCLMFVLPVSVSA